MARRRRWYLPDTVYEIEQRALQGRFLFLPTELCRLLFIGALALAQRQFPAIRVHAFVYLSNHFHALLSAGRAEAIPRFLWFLNRRISVEVDELYDWPGTIWDGRPHTDMVVDPAACENRLRYILSNGCKEGLVASPREWPGATSTPGLLGDMTLEGLAIDRDARRAARRRDMLDDSAGFRRPVRLELAPLPHWSELAPEQLRARHEAIVRQVEDETAALNRRLGREPVGVEALLRHHPHHRPDRLEVTPEPLCHASNKALWSVFRRARDAFEDACAAATKKLAGAVARVLASDATVGDLADLLRGFPAGSFPPGAPLVPAPAGIAAVFDEIAPCARGPT